MNPDTPDPLPPREDDAAAYLLIDHRDEEGGIVEAISARLAPQDMLRWELTEDDRFLVWHRGQAHTVPLQFSPHDRYILASSLVELLRGHYRFFLLRPALESDTHAWLVVPEEVAASWPELPDHLQALEPGFDHFGGIHIPYLNHEDAAPDFEADRARVGLGEAAISAMVTAMFSGKMDTQAAGTLARLSQTDPALREVVAGKSHAQLTAEIQQALNEALGSDEVTEQRVALDAALGELHAISSQPSPPPMTPPTRPVEPSPSAARPWWKFW